MKFDCPKCNQRYNLDESFFGKDLTCVNCSQVIHIPAQNVPPHEGVISEAPLQKPQSLNTSVTGKSAGSQQATLKRSGKKKKNTMILPLVIMGILVAVVAGVIFQPFLKKAPTEELVEKTSKGGQKKKTPKGAEKKKVPKAGQKKSKPAPKVANKPSPKLPPQKSPAEEKAPLVQKSDSLVIIRPSAGSAPSSAKVKSSKTYSEEELVSAVKEKVDPYFQKHCISCHGPDKERGDLRVDYVLKDMSGDYAASHLQNIIDEITVDNMPPEEKPRPDEAASTKVIEVLTAYVENEKKRNSSGGGRPIRRLTRTEFLNTAQDYYGVKLEENLLPPDLFIGSFENDIENLTTSDLLVENYMDVARSIAKQFIANRKNKNATQSYKFFQQYLEDGKPPSDGAARSMISKFSILAKRGRPLSPDYAGRLNSVFKQSRRDGLPFWEALEEPLAMTMFTVDSLFHFEDRSTGKKTISALELANRMSYTLWRSAPDVELVLLGRSGELLDPTVRKQQLERMMADIKFKRFLSDFTDQWLELSRQEEIAVEDRVYPNFDPAIKNAMRQETIAFFSHLMEKNLPITNFIDSEFMVLNEQMANFYGVKGVKGGKFRPVKRKKTDPSRLRGGILTHAGILMQGSNGERSHIVERGAFIARKLIDDAPADPPPNVEALPTIGEDVKKLTGHQLLVKHANNPQCASCHNRIDPLGVALENFDVIGRYRMKERILNPDIDTLNEKQLKDPSNLTITIPLESKGVYYNGQEFNGVLGLKRALMERKDDLGRGYIKALVSYVNGRETDLTDAAVIEELMSQSSSNNYPVRDILESLMLSDMMTSF